MAQQILLSTDKNRVTVAPGAKTELRVNIQNLTTLVDDATVSVAGVEETWVQVVPPHVPVFAQGEASVRVILQPPADPRLAVAGIYPLVISGFLQEMAGEKVESALELEIQFGGDYRIELGMGTALNSQETAYPFKVHNDGNAPLNLRCSGEDAQNLFWFKFDPFQFTVPAGGEATTTLSARSRQPLSGSQKVIFTLKTQGEWAIAAMPSLEAPAKQINGQWGAMPVLNVAINPTRIEDSRSGVYELVVSNPDITEVRVILEGRSANGQLNFRFDPPQLTIAPQGQAIATATVWPATTPEGISPGRQGIDFWVAARPLSGKVQSGSIQAAFVWVEAAPVKPTRPSWVIPVIVGILILILICVLGLVIWYITSGPTPNTLGNASQSIMVFGLFARSVLDGSIHFYFG